MRNKRLDILRCIAVLLVMFSHGSVWPAALTTDGLEWICSFVLSGFLISGLLLVNSKPRNSISFKRFLIRRGLKIYPAFYVYLIFLTRRGLLHGLPRRFVDDSVPSRSLLVQNYWHGVWDHTWSLAVEEHFYVLAAGCASLLW